MYVRAGLAERHKSPDLNVSALALCVAKTLHKLTLPGKPWLERHKKGRRQRAVSTSESSNSSNRGSYLHYRQNKADILPVIFLVVCSTASFIP